MQIFLLIFAVLVTGFTVSSIIADDLTSYPGKACNPANGDATCEKSKTGLECFTIKCACKNPSVFYYGNLNKCVFPEGGPCDENSVLTPNSECATTVRCVAPHTFNSNGRCILPPNTNEECQRNDQCDEDNFLICNASGSKKCECPAGSEKGADGKCQLKLDEPCQVKEYPVKKCEKLSECKGEQCICNDGLRKNSNGVCRAEHEGDCSRGDESPCDEAKFQTCQGNKCKCDGEGTITWYNLETQTCDLFLGGDCKDTTNKPTCTSSDLVECKSYGGSSNCACKTNTGADDQGLVPSKDKKECLASYDKPCFPLDNSKAECNKDKFYVCTSDKCTCALGAGLAAPSSEECVLLAGSSCKTGADDQPCGPRSKCANAKCACDVSYSKDAKSYCKLKYGATCNVADDECNALAFEKCSSETNKCACEDKDNMVREGNVCKIKANKPCNSATGAKCVVHASCQESVCTCEEGLTFNSKGECVTKRGEGCGGSDEAKCNDEEFLECGYKGDLICECKGLDLTTWFNPNPAPGKCELLLGETCTVASGSQSCSTLGGIDCIDNAGGGGKSCQCKTDALEKSSDKKQCFAPNGAPCNDGDPNLEKCNKENFFECGTDNTCTCPAGTGLDGKSKKCAKLEGSRCDSSNPTDVPQCAAKSTCIKNGSILADDGQCTCEAGYVANSQHLCKLPWDAICNKADDFCNAIGFQKCGESGNCECTDKKNMIHENAVCNIKAGKTCGAVPDAHCVTHSTCKENSCQCDANHSMNLEGKCVADFDQPCGAEGLAECNADEFQECVGTTEKKCACKQPGGPNTAWYNPDSKKCELLIGTECGGAQGCSSLPGVKCEDDGSTFAQKCQCETGKDLVASDDKTTCFASYGKECKKDDNSVPKCHPDNFYICEGDKCACKNGAILDIKTQKCVLLADQECEAGMDAQPCSPRSNCKESGDSGKFTCTCDPYYSKNSAFLCKLAFGAACDITNDECNALEFEKCGANSEKCECQNTDMTYIDGGCKIKAGKVCYSSPSPGRAQCVPNAHCEGAMCKCATGFVANSRGQCEAEFGSVCKDSADCDSESFLECNASGTCSCRQPVGGGAWFNAQTRKCELLIDSPCRTEAGSQICTDTSVCSNDILKCQCPAGSSASSDKTRCVDSIGTPCTSKDDCSQEKFLLCLNNICECGFDSWYNPRTEACELIAGEKCETSRGSQNCTEFSSCKQKSPGGSFTCECLDGFIASHNGRCVASYGAPCGLSGDAECNEGEFLVCRNGVCDCNLNSWFNPGTGTCELLVGEKCADGEQSCTENSACVLSVSGLKLCECEASYIPARDGRCYVEYGGPCKGHDHECSHDEFLVCENKKCVCNFDSWFNPFASRCELFAGEFCTPGTGQQACTEYAVCDRSGSGGGYTCTCAEGFHQSEDSRCIHRSCDYGNIEALLGRKRSNIF